MKNLLITLWFMSLSTLLLGQQFPPPENLNFIEENDSVYLSWSPPYGASPVYYNIYYSTHMYGDIGFYMGSTTDTLAIFPRPIFAYKMCWEITASYQNPIGESDDLVCSCQTIMLNIYCPYFIDFESPDSNFCLFTAVREHGGDTWGLSDETFISPNHSAKYISDSIGYRASLWTNYVMFETGTSRNLSFWYKIPENNGMSDTLSVHCPSDSTLIQALYATNDWQFAQVSLDKVPIPFKVVFRANAAGGNGIYLDDIRFFDETVDVKDQNLTVASVDIFPNPASSFFNLNLNLPEPADVKLSLCSMEGKLLKNNVRQHMMPGKQRLTMDVSDLKPGIYLVCVQVNDNLINQKLIKL